MKKTIFLTVAVLVVLFFTAPVVTKALVSYLDEKWEREDQEFHVDLMNEWNKDEIPVSEQIEKAMKKIYPEYQIAGMGTNSREIK